MENLENKIFKAMVADLTLIEKNYSSIARDIKISQSTIQKIVTSDRQPRLDTLERLSVYYKKVFKESFTNSAKQKILIQNFYLEHQSCVEDLICAANFIISLESKSKASNKAK